MAEEQLGLEDTLRDYEGKWVAISEDEDRVVGSGDTPVQAKAEAEARGYSEAALFKVRPFKGYYVYSFL